MSDTLNRRYEAGLAGFMRANQGKNLIPLIVDAADAAVDYEAGGQVLLDNPKASAYEVINAALGRQSNE